MTNDVFTVKDSRYELKIGDHTAYATYHKDGTTLTINYVFSPPELRGTGATGRLMQYIMDSSTAEGLKIIPICSYAAAWLRRHA